MPFTLGDFRELTEHLGDDAELVASPSLDEDHKGFEVSDVLVSEEKGRSVVFVSYNDEILVIS